MIIGYRIENGYTLTTAAATDAGDYYYWGTTESWSEPTTDFTADIKRALQLLRSKAWRPAPERVVVTATEPKRHLGSSALRWGWPPLLRAPPALGVSRRTVFRLSA